MTTIATESKQAPVKMLVKFEPASKNFLFEADSFNLSKADRPAWDHDDMSLPALRINGQKGMVEVSDEPSYSGDVRLRRLVPQNHPSLTAAITELLPHLWTIVLSKALQSGIRARGAIDIESQNEDYAEGHPVLRVYLPVTAAQALAFWDGLELDFDRWLTHLDKRKQQTALRDFSLRIHWNA